MKTILGNNVTDSNITIINTIPRFTYRRNFEKLKEEKHCISISSDTNWGCCIRCGQSMLFQYLRHCSTRNIDMLKDKFGDENLLKLFNDNYKSPFSLHNICKEIIKNGGHEGKWVSVSQLANAIQGLLTNQGFPVYVCKNSTLELNSAIKLINGNTPVLWLIPLMCGQREFDMKYLEFIMLSLGLKNGLGFIGGVKNKSYYYVGYSTKKFYYFDPHTTKKSVSKDDQFKSYFEPNLKEMEFKSISSSLMVGFVYSSEDELRTTCKIFQQFPYTPLYIVDSLENLEIDFPDLNSLDNNGNDDDDFDIITKDDIADAINNN